MAGPTPRRSSRKAAGTKARPVSLLAESDDFEPLRFTTDEPEEVDRVVLFYVDDEPYTIPKSIPTAVALKVLRTTRRRGDMVGMTEMLEEVLGEAGYTALIDSNPSEDELARMIAGIQKLVMGALETPKSSSRSA